MSTKRYAVTRHLKKHGVAFGEYIEKYYKMVGGEVESCGFCEKNAKAEYDVDHTNMNYSISYPHGYFCGEQKCKENISLQILGTEYDPNKYEKIGSRSEYISKLHKIDIKLAHSMKYRAPKKKFRCSIEDFQEKYGLEDGKIRYERRIAGIIKNNAGNKFPCTLENFINRFGVDLGTEKYNKRCEKISYTSSLGFFIDRYGDEEGNRKWKEKFRHIRVSKSSSAINEILEKLSIDYITEKNIDGKFVDFYIEKYNMCIEYFGNYWHMNPKMHEASEYNSRVKKTAAEIWEDDKKRLEIIKNKIDTIIIIWESTKIDVSILEKTINQFKNKKTIVYL